MWVDDEQAEPPTSAKDPDHAPSPPSRELHDHGAQLIVSAFDRAWRSGRPDWRRMTVAVLKNRLLDLTGRTFDERAWGVEAIGEFVRLYPDLVAVDNTTRPATAEFRSDLDGVADVEAAMVSRGRALGPGRRVRPDLWRAVIDFSSGDEYVWEGDRALPVAEPRADGDTRPRLPTITPDTMTEWRVAFVGSVSHAPHEKPELERWRDEQLGDFEMPRRLRPAWNAELKTRVVERLDEWFDQQGLPHPDIVVEAPVAPDGADALRQLVLRCVREMTKSELEDLRLPPAVLLRADRRTP